MSTNAWSDDEEALETEHDAIYRRIVAGFERLVAFQRPPDPLKALGETAVLLERLLKIQCLMRKAYPKRSRLARRRRRRSGPTGCTR